MLWHDQASPFNEAKPTYSAEKRLFYALCLVLFIIFLLSGQHSAACNICRPTYNDSMRCFMPSHQEENSPSCHMGPIHGLFFCIICIISLLFSIIPIISQFRIGIWVRIHCRKLVNQHIHHGGSTRIQSKSISLL
jgi:hypothetical protein